MATSTSISKMEPLLESVLGPITEAEDKEFRTILAEVDKKLLALARHFGHERAGWEGTGLELTWLPSGQVMISSFVEASIEGSKCVDFVIELRPSWIYGEKSGTHAWEVEALIYADSHCDVKDSSMERVHEIPVVRAMTPINALLALRVAAEELVRLGQETQIEEWITRAQTLTGR